MEQLFYTLYRIINRGNMSQDIFDKINEFGADGRLTVEERDELIALYNAEKEKKYGNREN